MQRRMIVIARVLAVGMTFGVCGCRGGLHGGAPPTVPEDSFRSLYARVIDRATGERIPGAWVEVDDGTSRDWINVIAREQTSAEGVAVVRGLPPQELWAWARAEGYVYEGGVGTRFHGATPSGGWPMTLALDRGTVIAGRVRRTDGSSPKGWILSVARKREGTRYTASHYLPADGTFRFKDVPNEPLQLHVVRDSERDAIFDATAGRTDVDLVVP